MPKDPAFLFYSSDFMMGTALMSEMEVGQYIRILCHMHQSGHLSMEDMKNICPNISPKVVAKFTIDSTGLYFHHRLEAEVIKRKNYSESRRNNRLKSKKDKTESHDQSYDKHMSPHMENENENTIENEIDLKKESVKKNVSREPTGDTLADAEWYTNQVIEGNDHIFSAQLRNENVHVNGSLESLARDHLRLSSRYDWHSKWSSQQDFRNSLLKHITDKLSTSSQKGTGKREVSLEKLKALQNGSL